MLPDLELHLIILMSVGVKWRLGRRFGVGCELRRIAAAVHI